MEKDSAAFEGWAVILKRYLEKDIKLDIDVPLNLDELKGKKILYKMQKYKIENGSVLFVD